MLCNMRPGLLAVALATPLFVACPKPSQWWYVLTGPHSIHEAVSELPDGDYNRPKFGVGRVEGGQLVGPWTLFHPNGNIKTKTTFVDGQMHGVTSFHWQHGGVHSLGMMEHGKPVGEWQEWEYGETNPKGSQK